MLKFRKSSDESFYPHQYRVYDVTKRTVIVDRDVCFIDDVRPARKVHPSQIVELEGDSLSKSNLMNTNEENPQNSQSELSPEMNLDSNPFTDEPIVVVPEPAITECPKPENSEPILRKSSRLQDKPQKHWDFKQYGSDFAHFAKAEKRFLGLDANASSTSMGMKAVLTEKPIEPKSAKQARQSAYATEWEEAMQDELNAFKRLSNRWVFKVKPLVDSTKKYKFKARLVIKGYEQKYGEDFTETWASVATMASLRVIVAISAKLGKQIFQMDVKNAFLNAELDEIIFTVLPEGFDDGSGDILLLRKSHQVLIKTCIFEKIAFCSYMLMISGIFRCLTTLLKKSVKL